VCIFKCVLKPQYFFAFFTRSTSACVYL